MIILPGEQKAPSLVYSLSYFGTAGLFAIGFSNLLKNLPLFYKPHRFLHGGVVGLGAGVLIHVVSLHKDRIRRVKHEFKLELAQIEREQRAAATLPQ